MEPADKSDWNKRETLSNESFKCSAATTSHGR